MNTFDKLIVYISLGAILYGIYGVELPNEREYKQKQQREYKSSIDINIDSSISKHLYLTPSKEYINYTDKQIDEFNIKSLNCKVDSIQKLDSFNLNVDSANTDKHEKFSTKDNKSSNEEEQVKKFNQRIENKLDSMNIPLTSNFRYILRPNSKRNLKLEDNNYSLDRKDKGNYNHKGQLVGTNRSIAAKTYETFLRRKYKNKSISVTKEQMKNLSIEECIEMYYHIYSNSMLGDEMYANKPIIVDIIFNAYCNAPSSCIRAYNQCIRTLIHKTDYHLKYGDDVLKLKLKGNNISLSNIELFNYICRDVKLEKEFYRMFLDLKMKSFKRNPQVKYFRGWLKWGKDYPMTYYK